MKMESGYFAYHGLVMFRAGLVVEVQFYSASHDAVAEAFARPL